MIFLSSAFQGLIFLWMDVEIMHFGEKPNSKIIFFQCTTAWHSIELLSI
jgi:hypothetical protein